MGKIKELLRNPRIMEVIRFGINGAVCFVIDYVILLLLDRFTSWPHWLNIGIGFTVSVIVNYLLCVVWVFKGAGKQDTKAKIIFVGSSVIGLGLTEVLMLFFENLLHIPTWIAKPIVTILVMIWNYFMKRLAVYGKKK